MIVEEATTATAAGTTEVPSPSPPTAAVTAEPITTIVDEEQQRPSDDFDDNISEKEKAEEEPDDDKKWCSCYDRMYFTSVALFLLGSILYLVLAVDDYKWAHTLLGLPMRLRVTSSPDSPHEDDDLVWMQYRLEERYQEYLSTMKTAPAVGVRRRMMMKRRSLWEEDEDMKGVEERRLVGSSDHATRTATTLEELRKLQQTPEELWYDLAWAELPEEIRAAWVVLGYTEEIWDLEIGVAFSDDYDWVELTPEMKEAASAIGFNEELWCEGGCDVVTADLTDVPSLSPSELPSLVPSTSPTTKSPTMAPVTTQPPWFLAILQELSSSQPTASRLSISPSVEPTSMSPTSNSPSSSPTISPSSKPTSQPVTTSPTKELAQPTPEEQYEDEWWRDLPPEIQAAYATLGYNEQMWDNGIEAESDDMYWNELTIEMQQAATTIGYSQESWDDAPVSSEEPPLLNATILVPANITGDFYDDLDWNEMPAEAQQLWAKLGYNEKLWDYGHAEFVWSEYMDWNDLSTQAQDAATKLGMNETYWNTAESTVGEYVSYDDDYIFPIGDEESDIWVSQYQIIYFFASLCFVAVGVLDLIIEKHYLHSLMILAGLFGVLSAVFVESDIHLSNVFSVVSVCLFFFEAAFVFLRRKHAITEGQAISMRRALLLGDLCFVLAAIFDIILAFYYAFDTTIDWDTSMMVFGIVAALLWLLCSLIYVWAFFNEFLTNKKVLEQEGNTGNVDSETGHSPLPPSESEDEDIVVREHD